MPLLLFTVPIVSTLVGGALALRFRKHITLLIAIGAGILLGAAFLDLLPEALSVGVQAGLSDANVLALTLLSFLLFHALESILEGAGRRTSQSALSQHFLRRAGAWMLIFHSFRDGMAIGVVYATSHTAGYAVALGIAAHDLGDGMNTVLLTSGYAQATRSTYLFLLADALAPFAGGWLTVWWTFSPRSSVVLLVLTAGFFLQMVTSDLLPELRKSDGPRRYLLPSVLLGASLIYLANLLVGRSL